MSLSVRVLGSSSAGNCTVLWTDQAAVLVDFGFPLRVIRGGLTECGLDWSDLTAAFITHIHGDHVSRAVLAMLLGRQVPVYSPLSIATPLMERFCGFAEGSGRVLRWFSPGEVIQAGDLYVTGFEVPHDSPGGCCGYCIAHTTPAGPRKVALATDMGYPTRGAVSMFAGADVMIIESNHDVGMLDRSGRPPELIRRIKALGHLSNDQCADLLAGALELSQRPPQALILAHISKECNTPDLAVHSAVSCLRRSGLMEVQIQPASPHLPGTAIVLR